jgi:methionine-rich copper-binding protein CopC
MRNLLILTLTLAAGATAQAHAFIDHTQPRVGSTIRQSPTEVKLWMTEDLEAAFSKVEVLDPSGAEVDKKNTTISGATMTVSVPPLKPGIYLVKWKAVATDTHRTSGTFNFTVQ